MDFLPTIAPPTFEIAKPPKLSDVTAQVALHQKSFGTSDPRTLLNLLNLFMTGCGPFGLAITTLANNGKMGDDGDAMWLDAKVKATDFRLTNGGNPTTPIDQATKISPEFASILGVPAEQRVKYFLAMFESFNVILSALGPKLQETDLDVDCT